MKQINRKRIFVSLRKIFKLFFIPEEDFEKKYMETKIRDIVSELMFMSITERFKLLDTIKTRVTNETIKEKEKLIIKLDEITKTLIDYEKI